MKSTAFMAAVTAIAAGTAGAQMVPDFLKPDVNSTGLRRRATSVDLSPRNYLHQVSAWYFGREN